MADTEGKAAPTNGIALYCPKCDYNLCGNPQATHCPECGWVIDRPLAERYGFYVQQGFRARMGVFVVLLILAEIAMALLLPFILGSLVLIVATAVLATVKYVPKHKWSECCLNTMLIISVIMPFAMLGALTAMMSADNFSEGGIPIIRIAAYLLAFLVIVWHSLAIVYCMLLAQACRGIEMSVTRVMLYLTLAFIALAVLATVMSGMGFISLYVTILCLMILTIVSSIRVTYLLPSKLV